MQLLRSHVDNRRRTMEWDMGSAELQQYADSFEKEVCFIFAVGPSIKQLKYKHMEDCFFGLIFTIGINTFAYSVGQFISKQEYNISPSWFPSLAFTLDSCKQPTKRNIESSFSRLQSRGSRSLISLQSNLENYNWCCPCFAMRPEDGQGLLRFGLTSSGQSDFPYSRSTIVGLHLAVLLGFKNIVLLGLDHGGDYEREEEASMAGKAYEHIAYYAISRGQRIWNASTCSAWNSSHIDLINFDDAINFNFAKAG